MADNGKLANLRSQIDAIDNQLLDLLRARANVIEEVRAVKGKQAVYIRPGREASMLRVLVKQPMGHLPPGLVHRLWREMIGAFTLQEGMMKVALPDIDGEQGFWDIARDHFGSFTPMQSFSNPTSALRAVINNTHQLAALPFPREGDHDIWWRLLLAEQETIPNLFYAFPFDGIRGNARKTDHHGVVIGAIPPESTGQDRSVLVLEWQDMADKKAADAICDNLPFTKVTHVFVPAGKDPACSWMELDGFVERADAQVAAWVQEHKRHLLRHKIIGAYPVPLK
ncbi:MAG: chorismate mutase [Alphaproteobacteria bacterium]|nr:chorismate mutase [Alphaproteobacteria bacterium]